MTVIAPATWPLASKRTARVRLYYDDQTAGGDSFAEDWRVDEVRILGVP